MANRLLPVLQLAPLFNAVAMDVTRVGWGDTRCPMLNVLLEHPVHGLRMQLSTGWLWSWVHVRRLNE